MTISRERLIAQFLYDKNTGNLIRRKTNGRWKAGQIAGTVNAVNGYRYVQFDGVLHLAHRLIWFYVTGEWPPDDIDHINRERDDNRWINLRVANRSQNNINSIKPKNNTSGHKGAYYDKRRDYWCAEIWVNKKKVYLGSFKTAKDAGRAYQAAAEQFYEEFAV